MSVDFDKNMLSVSSAHTRRGFLTGITMAELMLLIIFVLIMSLVIFQRDARDYRELRRLVGASTDEMSLVRNLDESSHLSIRLKDVWEDLIQCSSGADLPKCFNSEAKTDLVSENAELRVEVAKLRDAYLAGETPICTYERAPSDQKLHGGSVALGSLWVRSDSIVLLEKNDYFFDNEVVDKAGVPYDIADALFALSEWDEGVAMTISQFRDKGVTFERIGDVPAEHRQNCRFVMNYYIDIDEDTFDIFQNVVQRYFFTGKRLQNPDERLY
jgi:hypothetical protein